MERVHGRGAAIGEGGHHRARVASLSLFQQKPCQIQANPGIGRRGRDGGAVQRDGRVRIGGLLRLGAKLDGTGIGDELAMPGGVGAGQQGIRLVGVAPLGEDVGKTDQGRGVVRLARQHGAIAGLGAGQIARARQYAGQHGLGAGRVSTAGDHRAELRGGLGELAAIGQRLGRGHLYTGGDAVDGGLPLRGLVRCRRDGAFQQVAGLGAAISGAGVPGPARPARPHPRRCWPAPPGRPLPRRRVGWPAAHRSRAGDPHRLRPPACGAGSAPRSDAAPHPHRPGAGQDRPDRAGCWFDRPESNRAPDARRCARLPPLRDYWPGSPDG